MTGQDLDAGGSAAEAADFQAEEALYAEAFKQEGLGEAGAAPAAAPATADPAAPAPGAAPGAAAAAAQQLAPLTEAEVRERYDNLRVALKSERADKRAIRDKFAELEAEVQRLRGAQPQEQQEQAPDPQTDPIGYLDYLKRQDDARAAQHQQRQHQEQIQQQQQRIVRAVVDRVSEHERDFVLDNPDYYQAVQHLRTTRAAQYEALGYTPEQAAALTDQDALRNSAMLLQQGKDPAEAYYRLAKAAGFTPGATAQAAPAVPAGGAPATTAAPAAAAPAPAAAATPSATDALARIRAGQEASKSLSGGGGQANTDVSVEHATTLKGAAFDAYFDKLASEMKAAERV